ncbi:MULTISPECIES: hypothetical protein [unclassified Pseudomonas]|uniref:hypothetical protein n=1 Tax=unclassified Pseudomonas TaxID=196821 RepID=UPI0006CCFE8B|nr:MULTISPECIES: hypothetical protein [unclassified Pseudomonas]KPG83172.1 hypothetical protein AEQ63_09715 [Pseudomonas sp. RIT-PI-o]PWB38181.1 hypothetical protein DCO47_00290 [Pseudomonas sp. NDM]
MAPVPRTSAGYARSGFAAKMLKPFRSVLPLKFADTVIRSNGTTLSSRHDSSISIEAILPVTYAIEQFRWEDVWYDGGFRNQRIYKYYLGLYPHSQQVKLVDWIAEGPVKNVVFAFGNKVEAWNAVFQAGILLRPDREVFRFTALDQFGTEHKLAIRTDFKERSFRLERG